MRGFSSSTGASHLRLVSGTVVVVEQVEPMVARGGDDPSLFADWDAAPETEEAELCRRLDELTDIFARLGQQVGRPDAEGRGNHAHPIVGKAPFATLKAG